MTKIDRCFDCRRMSRRSFSKNLLLAASACGLGGSGLLALSRSQAKPERHKFSNPSKMPLERLFQVAYGNAYIPHMRYLAAEIGEERLLETLKKGASEHSAEAVQSAVQRIPKRDFATFTAMFKNNPGLKEAITFTIVEDTDKAFEMEVTECLWAKTFLEAEAGDLGFAGICFADYATAQAFNPKIRMIRDKTLMQGHDCCNHRYVTEA